MPCRGGHLRSGSNETEKRGETWLERNGILSKDVVEHIKRNSDTSIRVHTIGYPAKLFSWDPIYWESKKQGYEATWSTMRYYAQQCSSVEFELVGYSQGAHVAGDIAATIGTEGTPVAADRIQGVHLLADPAREGSYQPQVGDAPSGSDGVDIYWKAALAEGLTPDNLQSALEVLADIEASGRTFGALDGHVTQYCMSGDIICDARIASTPHGVDRHLAYDVAIVPGTNQNYLQVLLDNLIQDIIILNDPTF